MDNERLTYYKKILLKEKKSINEVIKGLKSNGLGDSLRETYSELSLVDNHPADIASETFEIERNRALKANEVTHIKMIDDELNRIKRGTYGICKYCGKDIGDERLKVIPYTSLCIECEETKVPNSKNYFQDRPVEEIVIGYPFGSTDKNRDDYTGYDGEDTWQELKSYNSINYMLWDDEEEEGDEDDDMEGVVELTDKISNDQYKRQLPD